MSRFRAVLAVCAIGSVGNVGIAQAHDEGSIKHKNSYLRVKVAKVTGDKHGAGRDLVRDGVREDGKPRKATHEEIRDYFNTMRRMISPQPVYIKKNTSVRVLDSAVPSNAKSSYSAPVTTSAPSGGGSLEAIAKCESGGNPNAVSPSGQYRGKYQFDYQTWNSVGGSGDPAAASESEQDKRAAMLYAQRGAQPWPVCGK